MALGPDIWEVLALVFLGLALGAGVELGIMLGPGRFYIAKRARKENLASINAGEWDGAISKIIQPIQDDVATLKELVEAEDLQAQIATVHSRLEEVDAALESRLEGMTLEPVQEKLEALDQALGAHLTNLQTGLQDLPGRVRSSIEGVRGSEIKAVQKVYENAEEEAIAMYEAELPPGDYLASRIDALDPGPKWRAKHEIGGMIVDGVKEFLKMRASEARGNVINMRRVGGATEKGFPTIYGGR